MLHPTARSAARLACRTPAERLVRCPSGICRQSFVRTAIRLQQSPIRRFSTSWPQRQENDDVRPPASDIIIEEEYFSTSNRRSSSSHKKKESSSNDAIDVTAAITGIPSSGPPPANDLPWYLKVDVPKHATLAPAEVELPAIPEGSPALMQPLLKFVADDLGLDNLELLDLRQLEPPAALGPNLLMLFGTARSDRHLHISADRLVRWLRTSGIHATADGLLGRNELKIKLRRKARRAKLLGSLGPIAPDGGAGAVDDGISTQWICLHAGTLGRARQEGSVLDADGRQSGFGSITQAGTTIVVQMFTDAKRRQLDLETLWSRALNRALRRQAEDAASEGENMDVDVEVDMEMPVASPSDLASRAGDPGQQQRRLFSTSARRPAVTSDDVLARLLQPLPDNRQLADIDKDLATNSAAKLAALQQLTNFVDSLDDLRAKVELGGDGSTEVQGQFPRVAAYCMRGLSAADTWAFRSWVHASALRWGLPGYTVAGLGELVSEMQRAGIDLPRDHALHLLRQLFSAPTTTPAETAATDATWQHKTDIARQLLDTLFERGQAVVANDVLVTMIAALARSNNTETAQLQTTLEQILQQATLPCPSERQIAVLLDAYATQNDWERFWATWRMPPQHGRARSAELYAFLLRRVAATQHQTCCIEALRWCVHEMAHEQPAVQPVGELLRAMRACIHVADPLAEQLSSSLQAAERRPDLARREFVQLLLRLERGELGVDSRQGA